MAPKLRTNDIEIRNAGGRCRAILENHEGFTVCAGSDRSSTDGWLEHDETKCSGDKIICRVAGAVGGCGAVVIGGAGYRECGTRPPYLPAPLVEDQKILPEAISMRRRTKFLKKQAKRRHDVFICRC